MSALATRERPRSGSAEPPTQRLFEPQGPTLEDTILCTWQELQSVDRAACPVCAAEMTCPGGCKSCGSRLD